MHDIEEYKAVEYSDRYLYNLSEILELVKSCFNQNLYLYNVLFCNLRCTSFLFADGIHEISHNFDYGLFSQFEHRIRAYWTGQMHTKEKMKRSISGPGNSCLGFVWMNRIHWQVRTSSI